MLGLIKVKLGFDADVEIFSIFNSCGIRLLNELSCSEY